MPSHLFILTGASRGMGLALAQQLLAPDHFLLCVSRQVNPALASQAAQDGHALQQWPLDLAHSVAAAAHFKQWLAQHPASAFCSATLINNAGVMPHIAPVSDADPDDLVRSLRVNLESPLLLTGAFLQATEGWHVPRKVLNISSGLGRRAMASQAGYCAAKAGLDHFTRCLALEEALKPQGARVCSLAPGVIDTDMQVQLRGADASDFPDLQGFIDLQRQGHLTSPEMAASRVLAYLARPDFGADPVGDVRA
jgi:benzil reductase ((S)-benzoin forming)